MFNEILDKCKIHGDKRGFGRINKDETPFEFIIFPLKIPSLNSIT